MTPNDWAILAEKGVTPDNLSVGGSLDLYETPITALPDNLRVGGSLYLCGTQITTLPDNLSVGERLNLCGTPIKALPDNLSVGERLDLRGTQITVLPDSLSVGERLDLRGAPITPLYRCSRGYRLDRAGDHYHAGCHRFTAAEAIAHWGSPDYPDQKRGAGFVAAVMAEEARRNGGKSDGR